MSITSLNNYYFYYKNSNCFCLLELVLLKLILKIKISWVCSYSPPLMPGYFLIVFLSNIIQASSEYFLPHSSGDGSNLFFSYCKFLQLFELIYFCKEMALVSNFHRLRFLELGLIGRNLTCWIFVILWRSVCYQTRILSGYPMAQNITNCLRSDFAWGSRRILMMKIVRDYFVVGLVMDYLIFDYYIMEYALYLLINLSNFKYGNLVNLNFINYFLKIFRLTLNYFFILHFFR